MPKLSLSSFPPYMNSRCCIWEEAYLLPWVSLCLSGGVKWGFPCGSAGKESTCNVGDLGSIPGLGRSPGEGNGYPLQYSGLENSSKVMSLIFNMLSRFLIAFLPREGGYRKLGVDIQRQCTG